jgi:hypothetical protein
LAPVPRAAAPIRRHGEGLAIFGGQDPRANVETARQELQKIEGSRLVLFENAKNYPQLDDARASLRSFGRRLSKRTSGCAHDG